MFAFFSPHWKAAAEEISLRRLLWRKKTYRWIELEFLKIRLVLLKSFNRFYSGANVSSSESALLVTRFYLMDENYPLRAPKFFTQSKPQNWATKLPLLNTCRKLTTFSQNENSFALFPVSSLTFNVNNVSTVRRLTLLLNLR